MTELLRVEGIRKHFDGVEALRGADFSVAAGEVHALMGENGAGKSTLAKIVAGSVRADAGTIYFDGKTVEIRNPGDAQRLGIAMIYQELDLFPHLSVAENISIGRRVKFRDLARFAEPFLHQVGLAVNPRAMLGSLRAGEMQMVAIARALASNARILLMDEPTSSLFDDAVERLFKVIERLKQSGAAIVYVSHRMGEIFSICDRATVLRDGSTVGTRAIRDTSADDLIHMMVGRNVTLTPRPAMETGAALLSVSNLSTKKLQNISFEVRRGEVFGIAGLVGAGRSEIGAALFGLNQRLSGTISLNGSEINPRSPSEAMRLGIALLPEDRKREGLMPQMSVADNASLGRIARFGFIDPQEESRVLAPLFREMALRAQSTAARVSTLSGGNQQKVLFARCLIANPEILFLDDPTRGVDVAAKSEIYKIIEKLASEGKGIIFVSSEMPELLSLADRILVMREGRISATFDRSAATEERIMKAAALV